MSKNAALKDDKKFIALLIGGSLLISLVTILAGKMLSGTNLSGLVEVGYGVEVLGWLWVVGTTVFGLFLQVRMRQLHAQQPMEGIKIIPGIEHYEGK